MKLFNAFQCVCLFAVMPFAIAWVAQQDFKFSNVAFFTICGVYLTSFVFMTAAVRAGFEEWKW